MHKLKFYPLGNADCTLIQLENDRIILVDFADMKDSEDDSDKRIALSEEIKDILDSLDRNYIDVVAITHLDDDHIKKFSEFFYMDHAKKYQDEDRIKINELWVPAAIILEEGTSSGEGKVLRAEARHRFKSGNDILVFSKPERLKDWLKNEGLSLKERENLIVSAGETVRTFSIEDDGLEIFAHAPFTADIDDKPGDEIDRNDSALILHMTFQSGDVSSRVIFASDSTSGTWGDIVKVTEYYKNDERLDWNIFKVGHHCSYKSLNDEEKGTTKTEATEEVERLFDHGLDEGLLISSSKPIPSNDEDPQPPHRQTAKYYREIAEKISGEFLVTMENEEDDNGNIYPIVIQIGEDGVKVEKHSRNQVTYTSSAGFKPSGLYGEI